MENKIKILSLDEVKKKIRCIIAAAQHDQYSSCEKELMDSYAELLRINGKDK